MNKKLAIRLIIDFAMTILLLCAYAYRIIGDAAHEWIGVVVFVLIIAHNVVNRRWYKSIFRGTYTPRRAVMTAVNTALAFTMTAIYRNRFTAIKNRACVSAFARRYGAAPYSHHRRLLAPPLNRRSSGASLGNVRKAYQQ
jgi:hypothetical protein